MTTQKTKIATEKKTTTAAARAEAKSNTQENIIAQPPRAVSGFFFSFPLSRILDHANVQTFIDKVKAHNLANWSLLPGVTSDDQVRIFQPTKYKNLRDLPVDTFIQGIIAYHPDNPNSTLPFLTNDIFGLPLELLWDKHELCKTHEKITISQLYPEIERLDVVYFEQFEVTDRVPSETEPKPAFNASGLMRVRYNESFEAPWYFRNNIDAFIDITFKKFTAADMLDFFNHSLQMYGVENTSMSFSLDNSFEGTINLSLEQVFERTKHLFNENDATAISHSLKTVEAMRNLLVVREQLRRQMEPFVNHIQHSLNSYQVTAAEGQR